MTSQRHERVKKLFLAACDLDENAAAAFLEGACAGDPELRREVESLLAHHLPTTIVAESPDDTSDGKIPSPARGMLAGALAAESRADSHEPGTEARFPPGTVLAGRYRIYGRLGRGGMGDVYRADDLKLDQPVALKFLFPARARDEAWLTRLHNEVRLARKVTHPNVNRIYDVTEAEGEAFISMEYVDGEDLASLLRRIGRFSGDKTIQIARQLCAGLGAAHDQGVLHRDLKPANVMIDGRGRVRIADFGIATLVSTAGADAPAAGTPAFMAPELLRGRKPSIASDLYSLGVVLYEVATGSEPFGGQSASRRAADAAPVAPSAVSSEIDPGLERAILACLQQDPRKRPQSTYAVAAALPGGDPLAAALAAGETPSPSMVAAAGPHAGMSPKGASACLAAALIGLLGVVLLADRTFLLPQAGLDKAPAVLADKARQIINQLGYQAGAAGRMQGFVIDRGYLDYKMAHDDRHRTWDALAGGHPPAVFYWYRQGDTRLLPPAPFGEPALRRKFPAEPGMVTVRLDGQGRLLRFTAVPLPSGMDPPSTQAADWSELFELAGLKTGPLRAVTPVRKPPMYADRVVAFEGFYPDHSDDPDVPLRVEAASLGDRVVYFNVAPPWQSDATDDGPARATRIPSRTFAVRFVLYLIAFLAGIILAWHNLRLGRSDRRTANRLALLVATVAMLDWLVGERHVADFVEEAAASYLWMARASFAAAATWVIYIAVEPYVRRFWPQTMITWSRLLSGRLRDPLAGRDILIGGSLGIAIVLVMQFDSLLPAWLGAARPVPKLPGVGFDLGELLGLRYKLGTTIGVLLNSVSLGLVFLILMLMLRLALRIPWLAAAAFVAMLTAIYASVSTYDTYLPWMTSAALAICLAILLTRVGLVALIVAHFVSTLLIVNPITSDPTAWYAPAGFLAVTLVVLLLVYGCYTALAGRSLLGPRLLDR